MSKYKKLFGLYIIFWVLPHIIGLIATDESFKYKNGFWPFQAKWTALGDYYGLREKFQHSQYYLENITRPYDLVMDYFDQSVNAKSSYDYTEFLVYILVPVIIFIGFVFMAGDDKNESVGKEKAEAVRYNEMAVQYYKKGQYNNALTWFVKAYNIIKDDPKLLKNISLTFCKLDNKEKAYEYLAKAIRYGYYIDEVLTSPHFAWLVSQSDFNDFLKSVKGNTSKEKNENKTVEPKPDNIVQNLKELIELKEKGLISETEFENAKKKILD